MRPITSILFASVLLAYSVENFAQTQAQTQAHAVKKNPQSQVEKISIESQLDRIASNFYKADQAGATVIVTKDGKTLLRKGYGLSNVEKKVAMQADHIMRLGSITKQFTAVGILMLIDEGKIALNDPLTKFIPDYPETGKKVTIEHLLTHTSGIPSYTNKPNFFETATKDLSVTQMVDTFKNDALEFEPGTSWNYNNSGYFLLGAVIEKVSGMSYAKFVEQRIFTPLGMKNSAYEGYERAIHPHAVGYSFNLGKFEHSHKISMTQPYAAGALVSTVDDLAKWNTAISAGKLLKSDSWRRAFTSYKLKDGKDTNYAYGWGIGQLQEQPMISHGGGIPGFSTFALQLPTQKVYVAVLSNSDSGLAQPEMVASRLAAAAMGKAIPEFSAIKLDEKALDRYVGVYRIDEKNRRVITREGEKLIMTRTNGPRTVLQAYSQNGFFKDNTSLLRLEFNKNAEGDVSEAVIYQQGNRVVHEKLNEAAPAKEKSFAMSNEAFDRYVGDYQLMPNFILSVRREGNRFITQATGQGSVELNAIAEDKFSAPSVGGELKFETDAEGKVTQLILTQGGRVMPAKKIVAGATEKAAVKTVNVSNAVFDTYVGEYQINERFSLVVRREGNRFITQATGQGSIDIVPLSETHFSAPIIPAELKFEKNAEGKVTHLVLLQNGRETPAKKVK